MTHKIDFKKELDSYQADFHKFRIVQVPSLQYLMVDGHGDPNTSQEFAYALAALYPVAYKLKFASKGELGKDYVVMPLEGLWWADDIDYFRSVRDKSQWNWTVMIMVPDWINGDMFKAAVAKVSAGDKSASLDRLRLDTLDEGTCVQTLHVGSFDDEADILDQMHREFVPAHGLRMVKNHHEIYFSDFRKVAPDKLRTILRHPVVDA